MKRRTARSSKNVEVEKEIEEEEEQETPKVKKTKTQPKGSRKRKSSGKKSDSDSDFEPQKENKQNRKNKGKEKKPVKKQKVEKPTTSKGKEKKKPARRPTTKIFATNLTAEMKVASANSLYRVGAHVSISGGVHNAVIGASSLGANCFACFLSSSRTWVQKKTVFESEEVELFNKHCLEAGIDKSKHILPHGSYLMNLGNPDEGNLKKSRDLFLIELKRCKQLGIGLYNFHPGATRGEISEDECLSVIADSINLAHKELGSDSQVSAVLECTAGQGTNVGYKFEHLRDIIAKVEDKSKVGVCLDTCHMFAAGYDLRTEESTKKVFEEFDSVVGWGYLKALHMNDSKGALGCKKDRHESLGKGEIGLPCFRYIMNEPKFHGIPLILETPDESIYAQEVFTLFSLTGQKEEDKLQG